MVVLHHVQLFAVGLVQRIDGRCVEVGPDIAVVGGVAVEGGGVPAVAAGEQLFAFPVKIDAVEVAVQRAGFVGEVVDPLVLLIHRADGCHLPFAGSDWGETLLVHVHHIEMVEAVALRSDNHPFVIFEEIIFVRDVQPAVVHIGIYFAHLSVRGVVAVEHHFVLVAVHFQDDQLFGVGQPVEAGNVAVAVVAHADGFPALRLHIIQVHGHQRVVLARLGVFVMVFVGVELAPHYHVELLHPRFVKAEVGEVAAVGRPLKGLGHVQLLLIHPVGHAVDDLLEFSVPGDGDFPVVFQILDEQVVFAHKGDFLPVRGEGGEALFAKAGVGQKGHGFVFQVKNIVNGLVGSAVDVFHLGAYQQFVLLFVELVHLHLLDADGAAGGAFQLLVAHNAAHRFACGEVLGNQPLFGLYGIEFRIGHGGEARHTARIEFVILPDVLQCDFLGLAVLRLHPGNAHKQADAH